MVPFRRFLVSLLLLGAHATSASAQSVGRGILRSATDSTPVSGALVVVLDASGRALHPPVAAASNGRFTISANARSGSRLRVLRIGQQPFDTPLSGSATWPLTVYVPYRPIQLATVRVSGRSRCVASGSANGELALVLDEVDKALQLSTSQAQRADIAARALLTSREVDFASGRSQSVSSTAREGNTTRPFQSVPLTTIEREGYATLGADGSTYRAPDADVLLSTTFRETHCFRLVGREGSDSTLLGVRFEPVGRTRNRVDVQGTMWVDRERAQLQRVEYEYTGLPFRQPEQRAGGELRIEYLPNGIAFVRYWEIRMPILREERRTSLSSGARSDERIVRVAGHRIEGGEVQALTSGGTTLFRGRSLVASSRATGEPPPANAESTAVSGTCVSGADTLSVLRGSLAGDRDSLPSVLTVTASWREQFVVNRGSDLSWRERSLTTNTSYSKFTLCQVPTGRRITLRVSNDDVSLGTAIVEIPMRAVEVSTEVPLRRTTGTSVVEKRSLVRIIDTSGRPVPYATVIPASQSPRIADDSGRVALSIAERGGRLEIRRLGFASATFPNIPDDVSDLRLEPLAAALNTVRTMAERNAPLDQRGFYRRAMQAQRGAYTADFLSPEVLESRPRAQLSELLLGQRYVSFSRSSRGRRYLTGRAGCTMSIVLDGVPVAPGEEDVVPIDDVAGGGDVAAIEIYASRANAPPELTGVTGFNNRGGGACGIVAIWTGR
jgi:hypothetical protein